MHKLFRLNKLTVIDYPHLYTKLVMKCGYFANISELPGPPLN